MDKDKIIGLFTSGKYNREAGNKVVLHDIINTYPYFQLAQVLYAREAYYDNDTDIANRVKLASVYAPDRKAMYLLFKMPQERKGDLKKETKPVAAPPREEIKYNFVFRPAATDKPANPESPLSDTVFLPLAEEKQKEEGKVSLSESFLEKKILEAAAKAQVEKELAATPVSFAEEQKITEPPVKERGEAKKVISADELHSFDEWLTLLPGADIKPMPETDSDKEQKAAPKKAADIIQQFLNNEPRISKPKTEFFSPAKAARQSISEDDDLVSETLAKIYLQQGNPARALKAYQALMLQNPQKRAYFAARIKEVQNLIDSGNTKK